MRANQARRAPQRAPSRPKHATVWARIPTWSTLGLAVAVPAIGLIAYATPLLHGATQHPTAAADRRPAAAAAQPQTRTTTLAPLPPPPVDIAAPALAAPVIPGAPSTAQFVGDANPPEQVAAVSPLAADGIPRTALNAYENAAQRANLIYTGCHIPWPLLAGIGRVESDHGRFGGAVLYSNGTSSSKIIGIPLDGSRSARVTDTDNGRLDGDKVYDRAVGPMQFIPSTWRSYGVDGNNDGVIDPFNIYDAAAAAADYLCTAGGDLGTQGGQERAVLAYNHSSAYLAEVLGLERTYAAGVGLIVPVGPKAPTPPKKTPHVPPVDPGPPLGHKPHGPHPDGPQHSHHPTGPGSPAPSTSASSSSAGSPAPSTSASSSSCPAPSTSAASGRPGTSRLPTASSSDAPESGAAPSDSAAGQSDALATDMAQTDAPQSDAAQAKSSSTSSSAAPSSTAAVPTC